MLDFVVLLIRQMIDGQKLLICVELEMLLFIVGEIDGVAAIAYNKQLHVAHERIAIAIAGLVFVIHNLLHGFPWGNIQAFQLYLNYWQAVNQQNHIIALVAILSIHSQLTDDFKIVFTPILNVYQSVM